MGAVVFEEDEEDVDEDDDEEDVMVVKEEEAWAAAFSLAWRAEVRRATGVRADTLTDSSSESSVEL